MLLFQNGWSVFNPDLSDLWVGLTTSAVLFVAFAVAGYLLYGSKQKDARLKVVLPMLCYIACLLALMSLGGHYLSTFKYPEIAVNATKIRIDGKTMPRPRPNDIRLETVNAALTGDASQILLLQLGGGKTIALPDNRYPVREIMNILTKKSAS